MQLRDPPRLRSRGTSVLAARVERAEAELVARAGSPGEAGALHVAGGVAVSKGPRSPLSAAFGLGLSGAVSAEDLDRVEAHLGAAGGEVRIELCADAHPSLAAELARRGYRAERVHLVLVRSLATGAGPARSGRERRRRAAPLDVRPVEPGEARAWVDAFAVAHLGEPPASDGEAEDLLALTRAEGTVCFAAVDAGAPVAVGLVSAHDGVAVLSGAGVVPAWRGRGLQLALIEARLAWAAGRGCGLACSAAEAGGLSQRNLARAGFRAAYAKVVMVRGGCAGAGAAPSI